MTFSIIVAAYNVETYICQALDSCINQHGISTDDYEILAIDDGSTDDTGAIMDRYAAVSNVQVIHKPNGGLSNTRNYGVDIAKGDYIIYLDGDDWLLPDALYSLKSITKDADLIVFPMTYWYPDGKEIVKSYRLKENAILTQKEFLKFTLGRQLLNIIPAPCKCYRRKTLIDCNQRFIEGILHEDNPYFADTARNFSRIAYIDRGIYVYRQQREGSITNTHYFRHCQGVIDGNRHILKTWGCRNRFINYMVSSTNVFEVILEYADPADQKAAIKHFRSPREKWIAFKYLFNFPFIPKAYIRNLLLLVDPRFLIKFLSCYYTK